MTDSCVDINKKQNIITNERITKMKKFILILYLVIFTSMSVNAETFSFSSSDAEGKIKPTCTCPDKYPLLGWDGYCYSCDEEDAISLKDKDSCERVCNGENGRTKRVKTFSDCVLDQCPKDKPLKDTWGSCFSCEYDAPVSDVVNCSLCPNRKVKNKECVIADCSGRPLLDVDGNCYPCSTGERRIGGCSERCCTSSGKRLDSSSRSGKLVRSLP